MRIILIRHGQTAWNLANRAQGHSDEPLDPVGMEQAQAVAEELSAETVNRLVSSDLVRAKHTAEAIAGRLGRPVDLDARLRERSFGDWEGRSFVDIRREVQSLTEQADDPMDVRPPNGESVRDVWNRLGPVARELREANDSVLVVTHGMAKAVLLAHLLGAPTETSRSFRFGNTAITCLRLHSDGRLVMERYNDLRHLGDPR